MRLELDQSRAFGVDTQGDKVRIHIRIGAACHPTTYMEVSQAELSMIIYLLNSHLKVKPVSEWSSPA